MSIKEKLDFLIGLGQKVKLVEIFIEMILI